MKISKANASIGVMAEITVKDGSADFIYLQQKYERGEPTEEGVFAEFGHVGKFIVTESWAQPNGETMFKLEDID